MNDDKVCVYLKILLYDHQLRIFVPDFLMILLSVCQFLPIKTQKLWGTLIEPVLQEDICHATEGCKMISSLN